MQYRMGSPASGLLGQQSASDLHAMPSRLHSVSMLQGAGRGARAGACFRWFAAARRNAGQPWHKHRRASGARCAPPCPALHVCKRGAQRQPTPLPKLTSSGRCRGRPPAPASTHICCSRSSCLGRSRCSRKQCPPRTARGEGVGGRAGLRQEAGQAPCETAAEESSLPASHSCSGRRVPANDAQQCLCQLLTGSQVPRGAR